MLLKLIFFLSGIGILTYCVIAQHVPYSLQAAVNTLHRRANELALKQNYDEDYNDNIFISPDRYNQQRSLNRLAKFLRKEDVMDDNYDDLDEDNYLANEIRKRSYFRERDEKEDVPPRGISVFRELQIQPIGPPNKMAEQFLREIEEQRELEEEEAYKDTIRTLWEKYQEKENEIENDLYGDQRKRFIVPSNEASGGIFVGPLMQKKQYPVLPWLPYSKKKRFPVAKRSTKMPLEPFSIIPVEKNKEKIAKDLDEIFGGVKEAKKKRSAEIENHHESSKQNSTEIINGEHHDSNENHPNNDHHSINHVGNRHHHHGPTRSGNKTDESHETSHEDDGSEEHGGEEHDDESDEDGGDDGDDDERKKKRSVTFKKKRNVNSTNKEILKEDQIIPGDKLRKKKSIDWSQYFGLNRKKKSNWNLVSRKISEIKKRSLNFDNRPEKPKRTILDADKIDAMDAKLKSIEDLLIDETIKFTGAHEGVKKPGEIRQVKDYVLSKIGTAYNLEKMRCALDQLRQQTENENHLQRNEIEFDDSKEKAKRLSVKKESAPVDTTQQEGLNDKTTEAGNKSNNNNNNNNDDSDSDEDKKKKRNGGGNIRLADVVNDLVDFEDDDGAGHFEPHNDVYLGRQINGIFGSQCPVIDTIAEKCRNIEMLNGDLNQELLPACGIHQLCYICGTSQTACDLQYLSDADGICGFNSDCKLVARTALLTLRHSPGPQLLGPKECLKNPCLYRAMREIGL